VHSGPMAWHWTFDAQEYADAVEPLLGPDPERHTIALTVVEQELAGADTGTLFGWWSDTTGRVTGAVSHTPPYAVLFDVVPPEAYVSLVEGLMDRRGVVPGVNAPVDQAVVFAAVAASRTGTRPVLRHATRLFRCDRLRRPDPMPAGGVCEPDDDDLDLLVAWTRDFERETHTPPTQVERAVALRKAWDGYRIWCDPAGRPVSLVGASLPAAGVCRIGPVYTPPGERGRGYAAAATWAMTRDRLDAGLRVVLFTDLANPTSNALYPRLGYVPVADRAWFSLEPLPD